ncbi:iron(III) transport system substrate-binding protein [Gracilibacillus orientalis]|uniref:Iron(III) transport system substrate-binding protein n=1 Tax=Gracilibacillus orientalis TaxID=334253 RepID=A0A1I4HUH3_9BACI|nr:ABC transporter substrate-binding protein [Gracilibacillus orientalis]SFL45460.1 iron(III) transport system substrate-binding protein [Gracilibacillus orientalis]
MKKLKLTAMAGIFTSALLLSACGAESNEASGAEDTNSSDDNTITVYSAGPGGLAENIQEAFEEETGIQVEMFQSTTGKILSRLEAEANNSVADVVVLASVPSMEGLKSEDKLQAYQSENGDSINSEWSDPDKHYYGYSAAALGVAYNTSQIESLDADWNEFSEPEWQGRVAMPDPTSSGSAVDFLYGLTNANEDGWDTVQSWMDNDLLIAGANKEALNTVITGDKDVVVSSVDYMTYKAKDSGEPIDIYYPESGTVISPRAAGILADAHNVDGAQAFIDFLLSDTAQQLVADAYILPGNDAIELNNRAALSDIPTLPLELENIEEKQTKTLNEFSTMN